MRLCTEINVKCVLGLIAGAGLSCAGICVSLVEASIISADLRFVYATSAGVAAFAVGAIGLYCCVEKKKPGSSTTTPATPAATAATAGTDETHLLAAGSSLA